MHFSIRQRAFSIKLPDPTALTKFNLIFISAVRGVTTQIQIGVLRLRTIYPTLLQGWNYPFPCLFFFFSMSCTHALLWFCYVRSDLKCSNRKNYYSSANHASKLYRYDNIPVICQGTGHKPRVLPCYYSYLRDNSSFIKIPKNLPCVSCCIVQNK